MDHKRALQNLEQALQKIPTFNSTRLSERQKANISDVITGKHLTFRYILITALLAKVTDPSVHMRSLQAGADLEGAYDARSLCHYVWVPFERAKLNSKLGGSNEPYLNKPARFPAIDKGNAVRKGYDQNLLFTMYDLLEELNDKEPELHEEAFLYAMQLIHGRSEGLVHEISLPPIKLTQAKAGYFLNLFLDECHGGESAAATTGALFRTLYANQKKKVVIHPVNQAGSSSNEIGDIDILQKKQLLMAIEVKDKKFTAPDVDHAIRKVLESGNSRLLFLIGRHAGTQPKDVNMGKIIQDSAHKGADISCEHLDDLCYRLMAIFSEEERRNVIVTIAAVLDEMRATDPTKAHFKKCIKALKY